jgi:hypothetical protein
MGLWDATSPNGLAYWVRLYPWGAGFVDGRMVLTDHPKCMELFPLEGTSFLDCFESKMISRKIAMDCDISVPVEIPFCPLNDQMRFNKFVMLASNVSNGWVLKPDSLALCEGVLLVRGNCEDGWSFDAPSLAMSPLWGPRFGTKQKLSEMANAYVATMSPSDVALRWSTFFSSNQKWLAQEMIPPVLEFGGNVMEIKVSVLGGKAWHACNSVLTNGDSLKYPWMHVNSDGTWTVVPPPPGTSINGHVFTPAESDYLTKITYDLVVEKLAPAAERLAACVNSKVMMRADFFVTRLGDTASRFWSLNEGSNLRCVFNEMQHHYGKSMFSSQGKEVYPIFERTLKALLQLD